MTQSKKSSADPGSRGGATTISIAILLLTGTVATIGLRQGEHARPVDSATTLADAKLARDRGPDAEGPPAGLGDGRDRASFVLASETAERAFGRAVRGAAPTQTGGRLKVARGSDLALFHRALVDGNIDASLDLMLEPGARVMFGFDGEGGTVRTLLVARDREDVSRLSSAPPRATPTVTATVAVTPHAAHHVALSWANNRLTVTVDGQRAGRAETLLAGPYRLVVAVPGGGAELRSVSLEATLTTDAVAALWETPDARLWWQEAGRSDERFVAPLAAVTMAAAPAARVHAAACAPRRLMPTEPAAPRAGARGPNENG